MSPRTTSTSRSRRLAFSLLPLLLLWGVAELGLRAGGYQGQADREVSWCREHRLPEPPYFRELEVQGARARLPQPECQAAPIPAPKPEGGFRAFALGGSAVHGFGFTRAGTWPEHLEGLLAQAWPERDVQVVNAGVIAWSSQQVLSLAKEVLAHHQPDALLIYSGNNELLEWYDARQYLPEPAFRRWVRGLTWGRRLRTLRSYRLGVELLSDVQPGYWGQTSFTDDEARPKLQWAPLTEADRQFAAAAWRYNIGRVLELADDAGVPVVLSTVAVNLDDSPGDLDDGSLEPQEVGDALMQAEQQLMEGELDAAQRLFGQAAAMRESASVHHRFAQALRRHGFPQQALHHYTEALRRDENPNRALPEVNAQVRALAPRAAGFVDGEAVVAGLVDDGVTDWRVIYDHCHPTPQAHEALGEAFAKELVRLEGGVLSPPPPAPSGHLDAWLGEGVNADPGSYARDPGTERKEWLRAAREDTEQQPRDAALWEQRARVAWHTAGAECRRGDRGCPAEALESLQRATELAPQRCSAWANRGRVEFGLGLNDAAGDSLQRALRCAPSDQRSAWYLARVQVRP